MKKTTLTNALTLILLFCSGNLLFAQVSSRSGLKISVDPETKLVTYKTVVEMPGTSATELRNRAFIWATTYYKNPTDVIRERDTVAGKMTCRARLKIMNAADKKGVASEAGLIEYTLKLDFKENKYRYNISEINWKQKSYYPVERWMDTIAPGYSPGYVYYLEQTDNLMNQLVHDLDKGMKQPTLKVKNDDW